MRDCDGCTLCCVELETHDIPSAIGEACRHCTVAVGCQIHESRPKECQDYQCMWTQMEQVGEKLRPDKCGIIFDRIGDDVITGRLSEDRDMTPLIEGQLASFLREGFSIVVFHGEKHLAYLQDHHDREYVIGVIDDGSKLH